jgi:hypothetical protein
VPAASRDFDSMTTPEILDHVIARPLYFKRAARTLELRAPDEEAGLALVAAFDAGEAPAWLTAFYLGCLRARAGYATLRRILERGPAMGGMGAESYAGVAMARIAGDGARDDLLAAMEHAESRRGREGALDGLAVLGDASVLPAVRLAMRAARVSPDAAGFFLGGLSVGGDEVVAWIQADDERTRIAGLRAVFVHARRAGGLTDRAVAGAARGALSRRTTPVSPRTRAALEAAIEALLGPA